MNTGEKNQNSKILRNNINGCILYSILVIPMIASGQWKNGVKIGEQDIFDDEPKEKQIVDYSIDIWDDNHCNVRKGRLHIWRRRGIDSNTILHDPTRLQ